MVFINDCAADGCYKRNMKKKQLCKEHQQMYDTGKVFTAFYGKTLLKKEFQSNQDSSKIKNNIGTEPKE